MKKITYYLLFFTAVVTAQISSNDLLAYYPFDVDTNNYAPGATQYNLTQLGLVVGGNGATNEAALVPSQGVTGGAINNSGCIRFLDNGAVLSTSLANLPNKSFSISYWFQSNNATPTSLATGIEFFGSLFMRGSYEIGASTDDGYFDVYTQSRSYGTSAWRHCVLVFDADTSYLRLYVDGTLFINKSVFLNKVYRYTNRITVGGGLNAAFNAPNPSKSFPGLIDELYIYNRVLTESEAVALFNKQTPTNIATPLTGCWKDVKAGYEHIVAVKYDGTLWAWGSNSQGQLGNGGTANSNIPVQIGTDNDWDMIAAGGFSGYAIKNDGTLWSWGGNAFGQLGDGTVVDKTTPVQVNVTASWSDIAAGYEHALAVTSDGRLFSWGRNHVGQLGVSSSFLRFESPRQVGTGNNWRKVTAGLYHSHAIDSSNRLFGTGFNNNGQIGNNSQASSLSFVQIGNATDWRDVSGGGYHTSGVRNGASVTALFRWGWLPDNSPVSSPINLNLNITQPPLGRIDKIANGEDTYFFIRDGRLYVMGTNTQGQLGTGTSTSAIVQTLVPGRTDWALVTSGRNMSAGITQSGELFTWGAYLNGALGTGNRNTNANTPQPVGCPTSTLNTASIDNPASAINVFPNPFTDSLYINLPAGIETVAIHIIDMQGRVLHKTTVTSAQPTITDLQGLPSGLYLVSCMLPDGKQATYKVVK